MKIEYQNPIYEKLLTEFLRLNKDLEYPNCEGNADAARIIAQSEQRVMRILNEWKGK